MIIGICGKLGSGKDYYMDNVILPVLKKYSIGIMKLAFADQIKINVMSKYNLSYESLYGQKTKESRLLLQKEGTEVGRLSDPLIWIKFTANWIKIHSIKNDIKHFVISDCRFLNEIDFIKKNNGIIVKIIAPSRNKRRLLQESSGDPNVLRLIETHASECALDSLDNTNFDIVVDNERDSSYISIELMQEKFERLFCKYLNDQY